MRRIFLPGIFSAALCIFTTSALASSPDAWQALYKETADACLKKSALKKAKIVEGPVQFSHAILYRIKGTWPQAHMKGKTGKLYCLHSYPDGEAEIVDAP
jgi:hypothetical protein